MSFHVGELVAQCGDPQRCEIIRQVNHEWMEHPGSRAMRHYKARFGLSRVQQYP
jgi:hypothetical protein